MKSDEPMITAPRWCWPDVNPIYTMGQKKLWEPWVYKVSTAYILGNNCSFKLIFSQIIIKLFDIWNKKDKNLLGLKFSAFLTPPLSRSIFMVCVLSWRFVWVYMMVNWFDPELRFARCSELDNLLIMCENGPFSPTMFLCIFFLNATRYFGNTWWLSLET